MAATRLPDDILLIDNLHLGRPAVIGTYVLLGEQPALVDPGPASTLDQLEAGLREHNIQLGEISALLLTHIHLDHAGASGVLLERYPHMRVYVHERGAPHMVAPEKLITSATRLYGDAMELLWGAILPVPEQAITRLHGGETLELGARRLRVYDAPGHASHHVLYLDEGSGAALVGDVAGVRLPGSEFVLPPTPPPDIDVEAWQRTLGQLRALAPALLLPTHFGPAGDVAGHLERLEQQLLRWSELVRAGMERGDEQAAQVEQLRALVERGLGAASQAERARYEQAAPLDQCWQGLARYWRKRLGGPSANALRAPRIPE